MTSDFPEDIRKKAETVWAETIWLSARAENPLNAIAQALLDERERAAKIAIHNAPATQDFADAPLQAQARRIAARIRSPDTAQGTPA